MPLTFRALKVHVKARVPSAVLQRIYVSLSQQELGLWAKVRPRNFMKQCIAISLYKDLYAVGYDCLLKEIKSWHKVSSKTLHHNTQLLCLELAEWSKTMIVLGNVATWEQVMPKSRPKATIEPVHLLMDSVDFPLEGKAVTPQSSPKWLHKCNGPG